MCEVKKDFTQYQLLTPQKDQSLPAFMIQKIISGADHTHSGVLGSGSSECRFDPCYPHHKKMRFQHPGQGGWDLIFLCVSYQRFCLIYRYLRIRYTGVQLHA